ncbi:LysR family transcriptional regulator [Streptomyces noursei]|uniref:LysR family transcriptional regulator n=1 Tax=Streptomyces noursei TaxID=1971 RepID=UPI001675F673|nr:LysR family transcriptional regulator [Streptomyces noursei]MCZ1013519.1 LysR family transcriptional regulator [Streptomyces noursei]GGX35795.1 LysR family transcriptional regulator [Streptomyces noursei]
MDLEIRHLRVVCAIAEAGSLTRAAAALRMTQPGLSAQLRRIETLLGGTLFDRRRAGAAPTPLGELVLSRAHAILPGVDQLLADTDRAVRRATAPTRLRIGSVGAPLLGHLLLAVRESMPDAEVTSRCQYAPAPLLDDLGAGRLEAAVLGDHPGQESPPRDGVLLHPLVTEPVFALLPATHPLAGQEEVSLVRLAEEDWAAPRPDSDRTREYWSSIFTLADRHPRIPYEAEGRQLVEIVRAGLAVSLCQATFIEVPGVAVRALTGNPLWYRHVLAWRRDGPLARHGEAILRRVGDGYLGSCAASPAYARWRERHPERAQPLGSSSAIGALDAGAGPSPQ